MTVRLWENVVKSDREDKTADILDSFVIKNW